MDILRLTVGEKFDHTMPAEAMSIVLMNLISKILQQTEAKCLGEAR